MTTATLAPEGRLELQTVHQGFLADALPRPGLSKQVNRWRLRQLPRLIGQAAKVLVAVGIGRCCGVCTCYGRLHLSLHTPEGELDYGIAGYRVLTNAGVNFIVDCLHASGTITNLKYHAFGTSSTTESVAQTALGAELTTQYATDNTRPTGTQTETSANIYETVATLDPDIAVTVAEHGIFDQAANSGGVLLDRTSFTPISIAATGQTLVATYHLTFTAGG